MMPGINADHPSADRHELGDHLAAAEAALRQVAHGAESEEDRARARRHAEVVAQVRRDFQGRPFSEGAVRSSETVDALLAGTDALRSQADDERHADRILEQDREIETLSRPSHTNVGGPAHSA